MYSTATLVHHRQGNVTIEQLNDELFPLHVPALIFVVVSMIVGIIGNLFVIIIYKRKFRRSNHRYFILFLAVTDLLACSTGMPFLIASLRLPYLITSNIVCKTIRYFHYFVNNSSGLLLLVIAIERFRKICRPFKTQWSNKLTLVICWGVIGFSAIVAIPSMVLYSASPIETGIGNLTGHQCYVVDEETIQRMFRGYMMTLMLETIVCICIFAVIYTFIIRALWKSDQFLEAIRNTQVSYNSSRTNNSSADFDAVEFPSERDSEFDMLKRNRKAAGDPSSSSDNDNATGLTNEKVSKDFLTPVSKSHTMLTDKDIGKNADKSSKPLMSDAKVRHTLKPNNGLKVDPKGLAKRAVSDPILNRVGNTDLSPAERLAYTNVLNRKDPNKRSKKHSKVTARVTVMLFTVSVFFALAFIPHLALMIVASKDLTFVDGLTQNELIVFQVFLRIFIINNVVNPIIYLIFDSKFRRYSREVFKGRC